MATPNRLTVSALADQQGLSNFDCALPQPFVNECTKKGFDPRGQVVWSYDSNGVFGEPFPLTPEATRELFRIFPPKGGSTNG